MSPATDMALKRFGKVILAAVVATVLSQAATFVSNDPVVSDPSTKALLLAFILAAEKWWSERNTPPLVSANQQSHG